MNKGYVKTDLGFLPEGWGVLKVDELVKKKIIAPPLDGNHGEIHPKGDDFVEQGVPFIMASDINYGVIDFSSCKRISENQAKSLRKGFSKSNDVLLTHKASLGRTAIVPELKDSDFIMLTPQVTYYRILDNSQLNNRYLKYYFDSHAFQQILNLWGGSGSTRAYLGITAQRKLPILVPPISVQQEIAEILSNYDKLIEVNTRRIAILEQMAEQIYKEWFVRMRFPDYENTKFVKGMPEGWEVRPLIKVCEDILDKRGVTPEKLGGSWQDEGISALSALNVKDGKFVKLSECKKISEELYPKWMKKELRKNDILMTSEAPLGEVCLINSDEKFVLSQRLFGIRPNSKKISPYYLYQYIRGPVGQGAIHARATGSTVGGIRQSLLKQVDILVPDRLVQSAFDNMLIPIQEEIAVLRKSVVSLSVSRDLLLPRLISGNLSVKAKHQELL